MADEAWLFMTSGGEWPPATGAGVREAEWFSGIEGTSGQALLLPTSAQAASPLAADTPLDWYRCRRISDAGTSEARAAVMMMITFTVPDDQTAEFDDWYGQEHIPMLLRADGWLRARRFLVTERSDRAAPWTSVAIHLLSSLTVLDSEERRLARSTPWRARFASLPWFEAAGRFLYRPDLGKGER
jgi:hypothetical protein